MEEYRKIDMSELKSCTVLVTPTSFGQSDPRLISDLKKKVGNVIFNSTGKPLSSEEVKKMIKGCDGYIAGVDKIDRDALENADRLKVISRYGVGVDNIDLNAAKEKGIIVTNTPGANSVSVAELAIALMLSLARNIPASTVDTRAGKWPRINGITLQGKTVGIIGLGAVGKAVAERLLGFQVKLLAYEPYPDLTFAKEHFVELLSLNEVLQQSDFITLHLPLLPTTKGLVDSLFLSKMKKGAYLVNTARGELISETALLEALQSGHLAGAALDVFTKEPPDPTNPLIQLPQVIVTPHSGAHTDGATNTMGWIALNDCLSVLEGKEPQYRVI